MRIRYAITVPASDHQSTVASNRRDACWRAKKLPAVQRRRQKSSALQMNLPKKDLTSSIVDEPVRCCSQPSPVLARKRAAIHSQNYIFVGQYCQHHARNPSHLHLLPCTQPSNVMRVAAGGATVVEPPDLIDD